MILVLNEWIFHDLLLENGESDFLETARFLVALTESEDTLVIPAEQRWLHKALQLRTTPDPRRKEFHQLLLSLIRDADRTIVIQPEDAPAIPQEFLERLPRKDVYLVEAYISAGADLLITTDHGLFRSIHENDDVNRRMRDDFLPGYSACVQPGAPGGPVG